MDGEDIYNIIPTLFDPQFYVFIDTKLGGFGIQKGTCTVSFINQDQKHIIYFRHETADSIL